LLDPDPANTKLHTLSLQRRSSDLITSKRYWKPPKQVRTASCLPHRCQSTAANQNHATILRISAPTLTALTRTIGFLTIYAASDRSEEHTSELQSRENLVCRLLLEK